MKELHLEKQIFYAMAVHLKITSKLIKTLSQLIVQIEMVPLQIFYPFHFFYWKAGNKKHLEKVKLLEWLNLSLEHRCKVKLFCANLDDIVKKFNSTII